jgi:hypothetical protein
MGIELGIERGERKWQLATHATVAEGEENYDALRIGLTSVAS